MSAPKDPVAAHPVRRTAAVALIVLLSATASACGSERTTADAHDGVHTTEHDADRSAERDGTDHTDDASDDTTTSAAPVTSEVGPFAVTATEFAFEGVPAQVDAGSHTFTFTNEGSEPHELLVFRNTEGLSLEEIAALGPVDSRDHIEVAGMSVAAPGAAAESSMQVELTPGEWEVVCFIPTPTDGRAHAAHGMHTTITVV